VINAGRLPVCLFLMSALSLSAQESTDLASLSVDDLLNVEVTSVSRKAQKLADTAAAVFVITQDDIRRSGATSIPEILRIVPGLDVARVSGSVWAISARGANSQFSNKLLVLIDGRSVYTPLFSGVFWDVQDTLLEDVERIEVIRGPGGTLWGANAVNGIINIITKHPIDTQGALLSAGGGPEEGSFGAGRYGGSFGRTGNYRVYGKTFERPSSIDGLNVIDDAWTVGRAGFRADWASRGRNDFTVQGDVYRGKTAALSAVIDPARPFAEPASSTDVAGQHVQFRWAAIQSSRSDTTVQAFLDYTARSEPSMVVRRRTLDVDFQQHRKLLSRNDIVWGAGYRHSNILAGGPGMKLVRDSNGSSILSAFVQDEIAVSERFHMTLGTKLQYDTVTQLQLQPTVRLLFKANQRQTIWAAATSAVRTPSEVELYGRLTVRAIPDGRGNALLVVLTGNRELRPERVETYELGYRWQVTPDVALDATTFHNRMRDLTEASNQQPYLDPNGRMTVPLQFYNRRNGHATGAEFFLTNAVTAGWNVALGYSFLESSSSLNDISSPQHQVQLRSAIQLPQQLELDSSAYYVGPIGNDVDPYLRLDVQVLWHPSKRWELSISGQNLLQASHAESALNLGARGLATPVQRTVNGRITWRF
jgi:iron complex outermembrane receptor protein